MAESEVARLREQIALSYLSAQWGLCGLASGVPKHRFITKRMEQIGEEHEQLKKLVGDQAIALVAETIEPLPKQPTRCHLLQVLRYELGNREETEHLLDYISEMWEIIDLLVGRFSVEDARKIIHCER